MAFKSMSFSWVLAGVVHIFIFYINEGSMHKRYGRRCFTCVRLKMLLIVVFNWSTYMQWLLLVVTITNVQHAQSENLYAVKEAAISKH